MGYRVWNDDIQTEFRITHLKRSRGDLSGELSISTNIEGVKTREIIDPHTGKPVGMMHVARFNVLSSSARSSLAKMLQNRTPNHPNMDWFDGLEWLCQGVIMAEARGESIEEVGTNPPTPPSDRWMVEPLVLKGRSALIFGPGGVGKSLVALTCALSVATGKEIIPGITPHVHGPILYLDWETTADVINDRIQAIAAGHKFKPENIFYRRCVRPLADDAEELSMIVAEKGIVFVVVDSAAYAMGTQGEWGDSNESTLRLHEAIRMIGTTTQIVDHVNKTDARQKGGQATPYGSAYKTNAVRISWEVRKAPSVSGLAINLYHAKSNDTASLPTIGLSLDWDADSITFHAAEEIVEEEVEHVGITDAIRELLSDGEEMELNVIAKTLRNVGSSEATIRSTVYNMMKRGQLTKTDRGGYRLTRPPIKLRSLPGSKGIDA